MSGAIEAEQPLSFVVQLPNLFGLAAENELDPRESDLGHSLPFGPVPMEATIGSYLHNQCVSRGSPSVFNRRKQRLA